MPTDEIHRACSARASGERALLRALLLDAIRCLMGEGSPIWRRERLTVEAREWVADADDYSPYCFENVCTWLGLPAERLRATLLRLAADVPDDTADSGPARRLEKVEFRARAARDQMIRDLRCAGLAPRDLSERFGLSYTSIIEICGRGAATGSRDGDGALQQNVLQRHFQGDDRDDDDRVEIEGDGTYGLHGLVRRDGIGHGADLGRAQ